MTTRTRHTRQIIKASIPSVIACLFLLASATVFAADPAASVVARSDESIYVTRYLPNILKGASGPGEMIFFLYKYLIGLVGIVAVGTIIWAGILRTISASQAKIQQSNQLIRNALKGIVLLFGAQVLFNTINPNIIDIPRIQKALTPQEKFTPTQFLFKNISLPDSTGATTTAITAAQTEQGAINLYGGTHPELAAKIRPCNDCASPGFGGGGTFSIKDGACFGGGCQINKGLISTLNNLQTIADASGIKWRMTEGYPPTVNHMSSCHFDGTCVDIGLTTSATTESVNAFINAAKTAGLNVVNEYGVGSNPQKFDTTTGGHLHVRL